MEHKTKIKIAKFILHPCIAIIPATLVLGLWETLCIVLIILSWEIANL